jgi:haloalkane dehalogenase
VSITKQFVDIAGTRMAYVDEGQGDPIVFLHGNPTSSYLWRNIWPTLTPYARCIAPDLAGMGDSAKLTGGPGSYRFAEHAALLDQLLSTIGADKRVTLVVHDWGSALGFDWAVRHQQAVRGLAYMEAFVTPLNWSDWPESIRGLFADLRSPEGDALILERNFFVEKILPGSVIRELDESEMREYRRPFLNRGEDRRPTLSWPRELPLDGEPADVVQRISDYADWLAQTPVPKLFINAEPGAVLVGRQREFCRRFKNQQEITVAGIHFIQEDSPLAIASALKDWYTKKLM